MDSFFYSYTHGVYRYVTWMALQRGNKLRPRRRVFPDAVPWTREQISELVWMFYNIRGNVDGGLFAGSERLDVSARGLNPLGRAREREREREELTV